MLKADLVVVLWSLDFLDVEIDHVVVAEVDEQLGEPLVLQDGRKELEAPDQFFHKSGTKLVSSDGSDVFEVDIGYTLVNEAAPLSNKSDGLLERNFDVVQSQRLLFVLDFEADLIFELLPLFIGALELLVLYVALLS